MRQGESRTDNCADDSTVNKCSDDSAVDVANNVTNSRANNYPERCVMFSTTIVPLHFVRMLLTIDSAPPTTKTPPLLTSRDLSCCITNNYPTAALSVPTTAAPTQSVPNAATLGASDGGSDASTTDVWVIVVLVVAGLAFLVALAIAAAIGVAVGIARMKKQKKGDAMLEPPVGSTPAGVEMHALPQKIMNPMPDALGAANFNEEQVAYALQSNPSIPPAMNIPEQLRVDDDGVEYTKTEFLEHYGRTDEWDTAAVATSIISQPELCVGEEGGGVGMLAHERPDRNSVFNREGI